MKRLHTRDVQSSPHTRGCFQGLPCRQYLHEVFPAYAGVFPPLRLCYRVMGGLPRIRGGVSMIGDYVNSFLKSSPHTRGCFLSRQSAPLVKEVFPAYAGVFLPV